MTKIRKATTYLFCDHTAMLRLVRKDIQRTQCIDLRSDREIDAREPNGCIAKYLVKRVKALTIDFCPDVEGDGTTMNVMISSTQMERNQSHIPMSANNRQ